MRCRSWPSGPGLVGARARARSLLPQSKRRLVVAEQSGAQRAVGMLWSGSRQEVATELALPTLRRCRRLRPWRILRAVIEWDEGGVTRWKPGPHRDVHGHQVGPLLPGGARGMDPARFTANHEGYDNGAAKATPTGWSPWMSCASGRERGVGACESLHHWPERTTVDYATRFGKEIAQDLRASSPPWWGGFTAT